MVSEDEHQDPQERVILRNNFYRDNYHKVTVALLGSILIIIGLVIVLIMLFAMRPKPVYFATTDSGKIIKLVPLDQPNLTDQAVMTWAVQAAISTYTYDFINYRSAFTTAQQYFTDDGWKNFLAALQASGVLSMVTSQKLIVSSVPAAAPVILNKGILNGLYAWRIQFPLLVTFQSSAVNYQKHYVVTLLVLRRSTLDSPDGVGIAQFLVQDQA